MSNAFDQHPNPHNSRQTRLLALGCCSLVVVVATIVVLALMLWN